MKKYKLHLQLVFFLCDLNSVIICIFNNICKHEVQGAAERTRRFGRGIASGGEGVQWWGARRRTAVYVPFSVYTMAWSGEHRAFIVRVRQI